MLLRNVSVLGDHPSQPKEILVENGRISAIFENGTLKQTEGHDHVLEFSDALVFPGLINSHDHLDFNLFPQLGNRVYPNYREWGHDIHLRDKDLMDQVLKVPLPLRIQWGMYKNLLNGFTTVVSHGEAVLLTDPFIHVHQDCISLHSVGFEKKWRWKLNRPRLRNKPLVIHTGEGTDRLASEEIDTLIRWNIFRKPIVGIHGVAMDQRQAASFRALVWCPASNFFLLQKTAAVACLKHTTRILFGSDSSLTSGSNLWTQLRQARETAFLTDGELLAAIHHLAADTWQIRDRGMIRETYAADIVVARKKLADDTDSFFAIDPGDLLLVLHQGEIRLFDQSLCAQLPGDYVTGGRFSSIMVNGSRKYITGNLPELMNRIRGYYPGVVFPSLFYPN